FELRALRLGPLALGDVPGHADDAAGSALDIANEAHVRLRPYRRAVLSRHLEFERPGYRSAGESAQDFGKRLSGELGGRGRQSVLEPLRHGLLDTVATES